MNVRQETAGKAESASFSRMSQKLTGALSKTTMTASEKAETPFAATHNNASPPAPSAFSFWRRTRRSHAAFPNGKDDLSAKS